MQYKKIEKLLLEKNMPKLQLAFKAEINPPDLYAALNGTKPMYPSYRKRIAAALGVEEADLFDGGDVNE